jgi:hypothetical protein
LNCENRFQIFSAVFKLYAKDEFFAFSIKRYNSFVYENFEKQ